MENFSSFDILPLWATFLGIVAIVLLSVALGNSIARLPHVRSKQEDDRPIGIVASASLGLLAFLLAFTFGMTASRFDARKQTLLGEVTAIETTALRAGLIPEPDRSEVQDLIKKYVELRLNLPQDEKSLKEQIKRSEQLQRQLWPHAQALADADLKNPDIVALFVESLNEMMNLQTRRVTVNYYQIPWPVWIVLFCTIILAMIQVGYLFGRSRKVNWLFVVALSLAFSSVMLLIVDLDRSGSRTIGAIRLNQQPLIDLHERLYGGPGR